MGLIDTLKHVLLTYSADLGIIGIVDSKQLEYKVTYKELANAIQNLSQEQQDMDVTVFLEYQDEFMPANDFLFSDTDTLDPNHPVITLFY